MDQQPRPIDRKRLKSDLQAVAKLVAKIASSQIKAFVKENEIEMPLPSLVVSQGLRLMLLSKVDKLCRLPDPELRNVLALLKWHLDLALAEPTSVKLELLRAEASAKPIHELPAMRASIERALEAMVDDASSSMAAPDDPEATPEELRAAIEQARS